jgi:hypothetical protein
MSEITLKSIFSKGWFESIHDGKTHIISIIVHFLIAFIVLVIIVSVSTLLSNTRVTPSPPTGYGSIDYEANQGTRKEFNTMITSASNPAPLNPAPTTYPDSTPMSLFQVATANFGGIFTEPNNSLNPWLGSVNTAAVTLQVQAGARAVIFDVWPDPSNPGSPIVASMMDVQQWYYQRQWASPGNMNKGVGRYSNWNLLTRNTAPLSDILTAATNAAFNGPASQQNSDPFFIILNLHGAMTAAYLNLIGTSITSAVGGHAMGSEWTLSANNNSLFQTAPVSNFSTGGGRAFVIAIPDIQTDGYYSLPGVDTLQGFLNAVLPSSTATNFNLYASFINAVNLIPSATSQLLYTPDALSTVKTVVQPSSTGTPVAIIQPSIGAQVTDNDPLFGISSTSYTECMNSKAQFVGINLFTSNATDSAMGTYLDTTNGFGTYSFKYIGPK